MTHRLIHHSDTVNTIPEFASEPSSPAGVKLLPNLLAQFMSRWTVIFRVPDELNREIVSRQIDRQKPSDWKLMLKWPFVG